MCMDSNGVSATCPGEKLVWHVWYLLDADACISATCPGEKVVKKVDQYTQDAQHLLSGQTSSSSSFFKGSSVIP